MNSLHGDSGGPSSLDAESEFRDLHADLPRLARSRIEPSWQLALKGLEEEVEDVIVVLSRLVRHEDSWKKMHDVTSQSARSRLAANRRALSLMTEARSDVRSLFLLLDVLLDSTTKSLRTIGAPRAPTESLAALVRHLENGGADWSVVYAPSTGALAALQYSLGYFRDKFIAHRDVRPVSAMYFPDGRVRLHLLPGVLRDDEQERGGREVARVLSSILATDVADNPLDSVYDMRLDIAFSLMPGASREQRTALAHVLTEYGVSSPDTSEMSVRTVTAVTLILAIAAHLDHPTS